MNAWVLIKSNVLCFLINFASHFCLFVLIKKNSGISNHVAHYIVKNAYK